MTLLVDRNFESEFKFSFSRSSGPGGQNVNKVSTRVELRFDITASALLKEDEKAVLLQKLANRINQAGELILVSQAKRSQLKNREIVIHLFYTLVEKALTSEKLRKRTKPTPASRLKRIEAKKMLAQKKDNRRKPEL